MEYQNIIELINRLFISVDNHQWDQLKSIFNDKVLLDYSSMNGAEPSLISAESIIDSWSAFLPGFDSTHHQIANFVVENNANKANVYCYGSAIHHIANVSGINFWTVIGTYNFELSKFESTWKIDKMKFNFKFSLGNNDLAGIALERQKTKNV